MYAFGMFVSLFACLSVYVICERGLYTYACVRVISGITINRSQKCYSCM